MIEQNLRRLSPKMWKFWMAILKLGTLSYLLSDDVDNVSRFAFFY